MNISTNQLADLAMWLIPFVIPFFILLILGVKHIARLLVYVAVAGSVVAGVMSVLQWYPTYGHAVQKDLQDWADENYFDPVPALTPDEIEQHTYHVVSRMNDRQDAVGQTDVTLDVTIAYMGDGIFVIANHVADTLPNADASWISVAKDLPTYKGHFLVRTEKPQLFLSHDPSEWPEVSCSNPSTILTTRVKRLVLAEAGFLIPRPEGLAEYERLNARYRK